jgi:hypothetical protein
MNGGWEEDSRAARDGRRQQEGHGPAARFDQVEAMQRTVKAIPFSPSP